MVTLCHVLEDIPDREAAEQVVGRRDGTYAVPLPLGDTGFDHSCLCYVRQRVLDQHQDTLVFATIRGKVQARGFRKTRGTQRTASIAVRGAMRPLSALATVTETLRLAVRALAADAAWLAQVAPARFRAPDADLRPDDRLTAEERRSRRLVPALVARTPQAAAALPRVPCPGRAPALRARGPASAVAA